MIEEIPVPSKQQEPLEFWMKNLAYTNFGTEGKCMYLEHLYVMLMIGRKRFYESKLDWKGIWSWWTCFGSSFGLICLSRGPSVPFCLVWFLWFPNRFASWPIFTIPILIRFDFFLFLVLSFCVPLVQIFCVFSWYYMPRWLSLCLFNSCALLSFACLPSVPFRIPDSFFVVYPSQQDLWSLCVHSWDAYA